MYWDVKKVAPCENYRLYVELENGRRGYFDVKPLLTNTFFSNLMYVDYFKRVHVVLGSLTWPQEEDIDPETVVEQLTND